jgi:hypothetical protein
MHELVNGAEPTLELCGGLSLCDLVLVEVISTPEFPSSKCTQCDRAPVPVPGGQNIIALVTDTQRISSNWM